MKTVLLYMIDLYRKIVSPHRAASCRFVPSCSVYAHEAIAKHGAWAGLRLGACRLLRCHPFHPGGYDPVRTVS